MGRSSSSLGKRKRRQCIVAKSTGLTRSLILEPLEDRCLLASLAEIVPLAGGATTSGNLSSHPASIFNLNGTAYFTADDGINGVELWRIGASGIAEMVEDSIPGGGINPGSASSTPQLLTSAGGTLYFTALSLSGRCLWRINGNGAAALVDDGGSPGIQLNSPVSLTDVGGTLYFVADTATNGLELWRVNASGVAELVEDAVPGGGIRPGSAGSNPRSLLNVGGTLYFIANDGTNGDEVWRVNSAGLAEIVEDAIPGGGIRGMGSSSPQSLVNVDGSLYFSTNEPNPFRLWRIDDNGIAQGINIEGIFSFYIQSTPDLLTNVDGIVYFRMMDQINGQELWRVDSDHTARIVEDTIPGGGIGTTPFGSRPTQLTSLDGRLFFNASDPVNGIELWTINAAGLAEMVEDELPGGGLAAGFKNSQAEEITSVNGTVFFRAHDGQRHQLWRIGVTGIAEIVDDDLPGLGISSSLLFAELLGIGDTLYVSINSQLWRVGTEGTAELIPPPPSAGNLQFLSDPHLTDVGGTPYFRASDDINGIELWRISESGSAEIVEDVIAGGGLNALPLGLPSRNLTNADGTLYFVANDGANGTELWRVENDGAAIVDDAVPDRGLNPGIGNANPGHLLSVAGTLYFSASDGSNGVELWRIRGDGVAEMVEDAIPGGGLRPGAESSLPQQLIDVAGTLYFVATDGVHGSQLWRVNGAGTAEMVDDDTAGGGIGSGLQVAPQRLTNVGGQLYFLADDGVNGSELWRINAEGRAEMIDDAVPGGGIIAGSGSANPAEMVQVNGVVFFTADFGKVWRIDDGIARVVAESNSLYLRNVHDTLYYFVQNGNAYDLWRLNDGVTPEFVKAGKSHTSALDPQFTEVNGTIYFRMADNANGQELWRIDAAGVIELVEDAVPGGGIAAGTAGASVQHLTNVEGTLYFRALGELWRINAAGAAEMIEDAIPGHGIGGSVQFSANPEGLTDVNGTLYFIANDNVNGSELWRVNGAGIAELVEDALPGGGLNPGNGWSSPNYLTNVDGKLYFAAYGGPATGAALWVVDPNLAPTSVQLTGSEIAEGSNPGSTVGVLATEDPDVGDTFVYSLVAGEGDSGNDRFTIVGDRLQFAGSPDFETQSSYSVRIRSSDRSGKSCEEVFVVEVSNVSPGMPVDVDDLPNRVLEGAAEGATVGIIASSLDPAGGLVTYRLTDSAGGRFAINATTGVVTVAEAGLSSEGGGISHTVSVSASDGNLERSANFAIEIVDVNHAPTAIVLTADAVAENAPGAMIGILDALDVDVGDTHVFSTLDPRFVIVGDELSLHPDVSLDFEDGDSLSVAITAEDSGAPALSLTRLVTVNVSNVNERPSAIEVNLLTIRENLVEAVIGEVAVADPDAGDAHTFIVSDSRFEVSGDRLKLKANQSLDFEMGPMVTLSITATDVGGLSVMRSFNVSVVDVNEAATSVALVASAVAENVADASIGTLSASDPDVGDAHTFSVTDSRFEVVGAELRLKAGQSLNYEAGPAISVMISAIDRAGLVYSQAVEVFVSDVAEVPTSINLSRTHVFTGIFGAWVAEVSIADPDRTNEHTVQVDDARFEFRAGHLYLKPTEVLTDTPGATLNVRIAAEDAAANASFSQDFTLIFEAGPTSWSFAYQWRPREFDVNADGSVSPLDALLIINRLNASGPSTLTPLPGGTVAPSFYDVSGDNSISPLDALLVINYLNATGLDEIQGEADNPAAATDAYVTAEGFCSHNDNFCLAALWESLLADEERRVTRLSKAD